MRLWTAAFLLIALGLLSPCPSQDINSQDPKERAKAAGDLAKQGTSAIPALTTLLDDRDPEVRREAVRAIAEIGTQHSLEPLIKATRDADPAVQLMAVNGLVNFYYPGYWKPGLGGAVSKTGKAVKGWFTDVNDAVVPLDLQVREDVVKAIGKLAHGGSSIESRANAARAVGVLRGKAAVPDLVEAAKSRKTEVILETLVAIQKIRDEDAAKQVGFLIGDPDEEVQIAAMEVAGLMRNFDALPQLYEELTATDSKKVRRAALTAIAMLPDEKNRNYYVQYIMHKDEDTRAAAAEGFARLKNPDDVQMLQSYFANEKKMNPRLSLAFALVMLGQRDLAEFSPLRYLIDTLNSSYYDGVARPFLIELAREPAVREKIYEALPTATKDEKIGLAFVLSRSGDADSIPHLERLSRDPEAEVGAEASRALRILRDRVG